MTGPTGAAPRTEREALRTLLTVLNDVSVVTKEQDVWFETRLRPAILGARQALRDAGAAPPEPPPDVERLVRHWRIQASLSGGNGAVANTFEHCAQELETEYAARLSPSSGEPAPLHEADCLLDDRWHDGPCVGPSSGESGSPGVPE